MITALTKLSLALTTLAFAHSGGHGPVLEGVGPQGGKLAAVVRAADAEKGAAAEVQAVAEWKHEGKGLEVKLWDLARKKPLVVSGDVKWILLGKKLTKPVVFVEKGQRSENPALAEADTVELILPSLGAVKEKHVVAISLR